MASKITIKATTGSDVVTFTEEIVASVASITRSSTNIIIDGTNGDRLVLKGTGFTYAANGAVTGGTLTASILEDHGVIYAQGTGDPLDAALVVNTLLGGSVAAFFNLFGPLTFFGNDGADVGTGTGLDDILHGGAGNDTLNGVGGNDTIDGGTGGDTLDGGAGTGDTLTYAASLSRVSVDIGLNTASGGDAKHDVISGFENLIGSAFADTLTGNALANVISGGDGNDVVQGDDGADTLSGGAGNHDVLSYANSAVGITVNLALGTASDGDTFSGFEAVTGSNNADVINGNAGGNILLGLDGNDTLSGLSGSDTLVGGGGADRLDGGSGSDTLTGDAGNDTFILAKSGVDTITDYTQGHDHLEISGALFKGGLVGGVALDPSQLAINTTGLAETVDTRFIYNTATGELTFDSNGTKAGGEHVIAIIDGGLPSLAVGDFDIV